MIRGLWVAVALSGSALFARDCSLPEGVEAAGSREDEGDERGGRAGRGGRRRRRDRDNAQPMVQPTVQPMVQPGVAPAQPSWPTQPGVAPTQPSQPVVPSGSGRVTVRRLPFNDPERVTAVNRTLDLIAAGGPFPFRQDGVVFQNRENRLPDRPRGYYHEYTVITPGLTHRGARRIITGAPPETWYTDDHYRTFTVIDPRRY